MAEYLTATSNTGSRIHAVSQADRVEARKTMFPRHLKYRTMCGYYMPYCASKQEFVEGEETNCQHCSAAVRGQRSAP